MAAPKPLKTYDLTKVFLVIGGYQIGGYGDEGGVEFEYASDLIEDAVGADGEVVASRLNDFRMYCTITLRETSKSYRDLSELMQAQQADDVIESLDFRLKDEINGDEVEDRYATFKTRPVPSKGRTAGERSFRLLLPNAAKTAKFGASITI